ncbi:hypothetical protein [Candidatus Ichthyocystis hellenicum]|uniref:hypothetical protein n=1 Tax=Candidatus Ichthyocystis hellenicum TaxID=1561003 RepID=UPI000B89B12D|nr:hypothetical protein [Candidatus Ichthyocystis hellenicum]
MKKAFGVIVLSAVILTIAGCDWMDESSSPSSAPDQAAVSSPSADEKPAADMQKGTQESANKQNSETNKPSAVNAKKQKKIKPATAKKSSHEGDNTTSGAKNAPRPVGY